MNDELRDIATAVGVSIKPVQLRIGADISGVDLREPMDDDLRAVIWAALLKYRVIFFRDQDITREQHIAFGRAFGELEVHPLRQHQGAYPEIIPVRTTKGEGHANEHGDEDPGPNTWHTDLTCRAAPPRAAILRGIQVPEIGGDTAWACAVSAYEGLDWETKRRIETLSAEHDAMLAFRRYIKSDETETAQVAENYPVRVHPVVRIHPETGERTLFVNASYTTKIIGLGKDESDVLLQKLLAQFVRPEYQVRFKWHANSLAFWDERSTQHYAIQGFEGVDERLLERVTIAGDEPVGPS